MPTSSFAMHKHTPVQFKLALTQGDQNAAGPTAFVSREAASALAAALQSDSDNPGVLRQLRVVFSIGASPTCFLYRTAVSQALKVCMLGSLLALLYCLCLHANVCASPLLQAHWHSPAVLILTSRPLRQRSAEANPMSPECLIWMVAKGKQLAGCRSVEGVRHNEQ